MTFDDSTSSTNDPYGIGQIYERIEGERQKGPDYEDRLDDRDDSAPDNMDAAFAMIAAMFAEGTVTELDAEPVLFGIVNAFNRQLSRLHRDHQDACVTLRDLADQEDFSEVGAVRLEQAQARAHQLDQRLEHLEAILHIAIAGYEDATGSAWMPPKGSAPILQGPTQATVDAKAYLRRQRVKEMATVAADGALIAIMGPRDVTEESAIIQALDDLLQLHPDMVLVHGADKVSPIDNAAAMWARRNGVSQIAMDPPDYTKHQRAAPFKRNDDMIALGLKGVVVFEQDGAKKHGISQNLAQKASEQYPKVPVRRINV